MAGALALVVASGRRQGEAVLGERAGSYTSPRALPSGGTLREAPPVAHEPSGCGVPDQGWGDYVETERANGARVFVRKPAVAGDGAFTLLVHFHGGEPVRRILANAELPLVVAAFDRGVGSSAYAGALDATSEKALEVEVAARVTGVVGFASRVDRVFFSSWSAGYKAIEGLLADTSIASRARGVVLLDSLHASFDGPDRALHPETIAPFVAAARRAAAGESTFFFGMVHTDVKTPDYASTTETANVILAAAGVIPERVDPGDRAFALTRVAEREGFVLRGYRGGDESAHCNALYVLPELLRRGLTGSQAQPRGPSSAATEP